MSKEILRLLKNMYEAGGYKTYTQDQLVLDMVCLDDVIEGYTYFYSSRQTQMAYFEITLKGLWFLFLNNKGLKHEHS